MWRQAAASLRGPFLLLLPQPPPPAHGCNHHQPACRPPPPPPHTHTHTQDAYLDVTVPVLGATLRVLEAEHRQVAGDVDPRLAKRLKFLGGRRERGGAEADAQGGQAGGGGGGGGGDGVIGGL